jgi:hypothetical protein
MLGDTVFSGFGSGSLTHYSVVHLFAPFEAAGTGSLAVCVYTVFFDLLEGFGKGGSGVGRGRTMKRERGRQKRKRHERTPERKHDSKTRTAWGSRPFFLPPSIYTYILDGTRETRSACKDIYTPRQDIL